MYLLVQKESSTMIFTSIEVKSEQSVKEVKGSTLPTMSNLSIDACLLEWAY